jgi:hypothetical protein
MTCRCCRQPSFLQPCFFIVYSAVAGPPCCPGRHSPRCYTSFYNKNYGKARGFRQREIQCMFAILVDLTASTCFVRHPQQKHPKQKHVYRSIHCMQNGAWVQLATWRFTGDETRHCTRKCSAQTLCSHHNSCLHWSLTEFLMPNYGRQ